MSRIEIQKVTDEQQLQEVFAIREKVFVEEQRVPREEEYDIFEDTSEHYLALYDGKPCGAARWRLTDDGVKLERFAVLKEYRNKEVGSELLKQVVSDVKEAQPGKMVYLHAQLPAMKFYERHGFSKFGDMFSECDIDHYKMIMHG